MFHCPLASKVSRVSPFRESAIAVSGTTRGAIIMINNMTGNLLLADVEALVNAVNTVGVMGKGIALQFRRAFPANYAAYRTACARNEVRPGEMFVFPTNNPTGPRLIINFPTKRDWRSKSRLEDIEAGLYDLVAVVKREKITSLAIPPLGCGNGGLDWAIVRPKIEAACAELTDVTVLLYMPDDAER